MTREAKEMTLRIQKSFESKLVVYRLSGRIQGEQVPELQTLLESEPSGQAVVLDLACVKLVDREAVQFLARCEAVGLKLINCAAYIRPWIKQEMSVMQRKQADNARDLAG